MSPGINILGQDAENGVLELGCPMEIPLLRSDWDRFIATLEMSKLSGGGTCWTSPILTHPKMPTL